MALTPEEEKLAREVEAGFRGEDLRRLRLVECPRDLGAIQKFSIHRIEEALRVLDELEFLSAEDQDMTHVPEENRKLHLAQRVLLGLKEYDNYYRRVR